MAPGVLFRMTNGQVRRIENLLPGDDMFGGRTITKIICFKARKVYEYNNICTEGTYYVLENNTWVMIKDSPNSIRRPDLDGKLMYMVENDNHKMIDINGTTFSDASERAYG